MTAAINATLVRTANGQASPAPDRFRLARRDVGGPFSLIDRRPLTIDAVPGLAVHVRTGSLAISQGRGSVEHIVRTGKRFRANAAGPLVVRPLARVELHLDWPPATHEQAPAPARVR